ncbi:MAG: SH3 domain-containing protein [Acutalibacteraceae bacterium]
MKNIFKTLFCLSAVLFCLALFSQDAGAATASSTAGRVKTTSGNLNVRQTSASDSKVIKTLKSGTYITLISTKDGRYKVEYANGKYGYCHPSYIKKVSSSSAMFVTATKLNVRRKAGTQYDIKTTLDFGKAVVVLKNYGQWSRILYNGNKTGYVASKYLSSTKPSLKKISLSLPSFKQYDSRWKNAKIGTQGDTIGTSGCTTTALAMTESFRLSRTVDVLEMRSQLSYSSSGQLYWPKNYVTAVSSQSGFLEDIYSVLKQNKPVIVAVKKKNGSQHWVVVTGFSGSSLTASAFSINDPGSASRKTLADLMADYPLAYKTVWYT